MYLISTTLRNMVANIFRFSALFQIILLLNSGISFGQRPTVMAVPSDRYMNEKGYMNPFTHPDGRADAEPDYRKAFLNDRYLATLLSTISAAFQDIGYPIKDLEAALQAVENRSGEVMLSENNAEMTLRDQLLTQAKSDILLEVDFFVEKVMGEETISFTIDALDSFTSQSVATVNNTGLSGNGTPFSTLVREAVIQNMPEFEGRLDTYFKSLLEDGRVGVVEVMISMDSPIDLETWIPFEGDEEELGFIIRDIIKKRSLNSRYHIATQTRTLLVFDEVRIPLFDDEGYPQDTISWVNNELFRPLRRDYGIDAARETVGLGQARIIIRGER